MHGASLHLFAAGSGGAGKPSLNNILPDGSESFRYRPLMQGFRKTVARAAKACFNREK